MIELIDKRKPNEKRFLKDNGNIEIQMFRNNIHYLKDGKYEEISNELKENEETLENYENDYKVIFNKKNGGIKYIKGDNYIEFIPKDYKNVVCILEKNTKEVSKVLYKNIVDNIDLEYVLSFEGVKENIIINEYTKLDKIQFDIKSNLTIKNENKVLEARKEKELLFDFSIPYMKDSNGNESDEVTYSVRKKEEDQLLTISFSNEWLKSKDRKYPIIIDPTYENNTNVEDTYIYPGDTNDVRYNRNYLNAGVEMINNQERKNRALVRFNLPSDIAPGDEIIRAEISLYGYLIAEDRIPTDTEMLQNNNKLLNVHEVTSDWTLQGAKWDDMSNAYNPIVENVAYISRSYLEYDIENPGPHNFVINYHSNMNSCLITNLVKKWLNGSPNYGIMIKQPQETYINALTPKLFSSNYGNGYLAPYLSIEYRNQNGLESYWDYMTQTFTNGNTYVNTFNGNLTAMFNLSKTIGAFPANVGIVYNTNDVIQNNNTIYGKGYKLTYEQTIEDISQGNNRFLKYTDGDGTQHIFIGEEDSQHNLLFFDNDGLDLTIMQNGVDYVLCEKNGSQMNFVLYGSKYYLSSITNSSNQTILISRNLDNHITKISDFNNNEINITYGNNIITFTSPSETTTLNYENNNLKTIVTKEGTTTFTYDTENKIIKIVDVNGLSIEYEYLTGEIKKVSKVTQFGLNDTEGQSFTLEYNLFHSKITDNEGKIKNNIYGYYGNLVSSNNMTEGENIKDAYSVTRSFGNENENKNKILTNTYPIKFSKNYACLTNWDELYGITVFSNNMGFSDYYDHDFDGVSLIEFISDNVNQYSLTGFSLPADKEYTVKLYIKTSLSSKIKFYVNSTNILFEKVIISSNEYEKIQFTFNKDSSSDLMMRIEHENPCSTFIGDIYIEEGSILNSQNLITNADFYNGTEGWNLEAQILDSNEIIENQNNNLVPSDYMQVVDIDTFGNKALRINMESPNMTNVSKTLYIKGTSSDLYYFGFWYKNNGIETDVDPTIPYDPVGTIVGNTISIVALPEEGEIEHCVPVTSLNTCKDVWQYYHVLFNPIENYRAIRIDLHQGRNAGQLFLTDFSLIKKFKTDKYSYDEKGNIVEVNNTDESSIFKYSKNNELISTTNPRGKHFKIEYDNSIRDRVIRAISSSGISNKIDYDLFGNPIKTRISKDYNEEIMTGFYKIRQKGTNNYLKIQNNNLTLMNDYCSNTTFKITKINDLYNISDAIINSKYISEESGRVVLKSTGNINLKIEKNENASYHIYYEFSVGEEQFKKYLKWVDNQFAFVDNYLDIDDNNLYEYYIEDAQKLFIEREAEYTQDGRFISKLKDSLLNETSYIINNNNGLLTKITNSNDIETNYIYNNKQQLTKITQNNKEVDYSYNNQNLLSNVINGNKNYSIHYDDFLNICNIKINNRDLITNSYENYNGNLLSSTYGNNNLISYQYDDYNRLKKIIKENENYEYYYDNNGLICKIIETNTNTNTYTIISFQYDNNKRLCEYIKDDNVNLFKIINKIDKDDNITNQMFILNQDVHNINNIFDKEGNVLESNLDLTNIKYSYDSLKRLTKKIINNTFETKYEYVSIGNRTSKLKKSITNGSDVYLYKYDKLYNIIDVYFNGVISKHYTYNNNNELICCDDHFNNIKYEYVYDNKGNILSKTKKNLITGGTISSDLFEYNDSSWEDLLTKYNNESITYDTIGNPISIDNKVLTWTNGRQLKSFSNGNTIVLYKYNANGIRTKKTINGVDTDYFIENNLIIYEKTGNNIIYYLYDDGDIIGLKYNNMVYYYIKNVQGDIVGIIDSNYQIVARYEYDSMGTILSIKNSSGQEITDQSNVAIVNPFRYRGYYYDKETELYYLNSRYYNPNWGRFLNADGLIYLEQSIMACNLFVYTANNYINHSDTNGKWFIFDFFEKVIEETVNFVESIFDYSAKKYGVNNVEPPIKNKKRKAAKPSPTYYSINNIIDNSKLTCNVGVSYSGGGGYVSANYTREIAPNSNINKSAVSIGAGITESASVFGPLSLSASVKFETKIRNLTDLVYPKYYSPYTSSISGGFNGLNSNIYVPVYSNNGQLNFNTAVGIDYGAEYTIEWDE